MSPTLDSEELDRRQIRRERGNKTRREARYSKSTDSYAQYKDSPFQLRRSAIRILTWGHSRASKSSHISLDSRRVSNSYAFSYAVVIHPECVHLIMQIDGRAVGIGVKNECKDTINFAYV